MDEQPRPVANGNEQAYTLTVEEAAALYEAAGHARTMRAIQKYCFRGDLTAIREQTTYGERYRITPASVARHIEQIEQLSQSHRRERPRTDAAVRAEEVDHESEKNDGASVREQPRPAATDDRYIGQLERENSYLRAQNDKKDQHLESRDRQIEAMIERDRETNILIERLQNHIPMLPQPDRRGEEARPMPHTEMPHDAAAEG
jgi:predicted RNase H-like nuclease (RuvC/YqgF family)